MSEKAQGWILFSTIEVVGWAVVIGIILWSLE